MLIYTKQNHTESTGINNHDPRKSLGDVGTVCFGNEVTILCIILLIISIFLKQKQVKKM